jgi:hypothetical protein
MSNPLVLDPAVQAIYDAEDPPTTGVAKAIKEVMQVLDRYDIDYASKTRVLTKVQMMINEKERLSEEGINTSPPW